MSSFPSSCEPAYRPVRRIASGGFGEVWEARQHELDRTVAIKVLLADARRDPEQVARFGTEAQITARLTHPHVVRVLDHGAGDGVPWVVYEFVDGPSVRALLESGPLAPAEAATVARQVAEALAAAHAAGILHRDVKPDNVLRAAPGLYKLTDFGIAKWRESTAVKTATGVILGTPDYIAPELVEGQSAGAAADQYALGVMLFELLTGRRPFTGDNPVQVLERHLRAPVPDLHALRPGLPDGLAQVVRRALEKRPEQRFASAAAFAEALQPFADSGTIDRTKTVAVVSPALTRPGEPRDAARRAVAVAAAPPAARVPVAIALAVALAVTAGAGLALRTQTADPSPPGPSAGAVPALAVAPPPYPGHRQLAVRATRAVPAGALAHACFADGSAACPAVPLSLDGSAVLTDVPPAADLYVALVDAAGHPLDRGPSVRTPEVAPVLGVKLVPMATSLTLSFDLSRPVSMTVQVVREGDGHLVASAAVPAGGAWFRRELEGLRPDTDYLVRIRQASGWGGAGDLRVSTWNEARLKAWDTWLEDVRAQGMSLSVQHLGALDLEADPHLREVMDRLCAGPWQSRTPDSDALAQFARRAEDLAEPSMTDHLARFLMQDARLSEEVVDHSLAAMGAVHHRRTFEAARRFRETNRFYAAAALSRIGGPEACEEVARCTRSTDGGLHLIARLMVRADRERARALFRAYLRAPPPDTGPGKILPLYGLAHLGTEADVQTALQTLLREPDTLTNTPALAELGTPAARRAVAELLRTRPGDPAVGWSAALLRLPETLAALRGQLADTRPGTQARCNAVAAMGVLGDAGAAPEVLAALAEPDPATAHVAAWALGSVARPTDYPVIEAFAASLADADGEAALALAALGDRHAVDALTRLSGELARTPGKLVRVRAAAVAHALRTLGGTPAPDGLAVSGPARACEIETAKHVADAARSPDARLVTVSVQAPLVRTGLHLHAGDVVELRGAGLLHGTKSGRLAGAELGLHEDEDGVRASMWARPGTGEPMKITSHWQSLVAAHEGDLYLTLDSEDYAGSITTSRGKRASGFAVVELRRSAR